MRVSMYDMFFSVPSVSPEALSFSSVFIIWFWLLLGLRRNPESLRRNLGLWARSLVWTS